MFVQDEPAYFRTRDKLIHDDAESFMFVSDLQWCVVIEIGKCIIFVHCNIDTVGCIHLSRARRILRIKRIIKKSPLSRITSCSYSSYLFAFYLHGLSRCTTSMFASWGVCTQAHSYGSVRLPGVSRRAVTEREGGSECERRTDWTRAATAG